MTPEQRLQQLVELLSRGTLRLLSSKQVTQPVDAANEGGEV